MRQLPAARKWNAWSQKSTLVLCSSFCKHCFTRGKKKVLEHQSKIPGLWKKCYSLAQVREQRAGSSVPCHVSTPQLVVHTSTYSQLEKSIRTRFVSSYSQFLNRSDDSHPAVLVSFEQRIKHKLQENKAKHFPLWLGRRSLPFTVCLIEYIDVSV